MFKRALFILIALSLIVPFVYAGERVVTVGGNQATRPIEDFLVNVSTEYYVCSVTGDDGRAGKSKATAVATLAQALDLVTASKNDIIYLLPGHAETIASAAAIAVDVIGVRIIGLGEGALRPTFTFSALDSTITFTAASTSMENVILIPSIDSVVSGIVVSAANVKLDVEVQDATDIEFVTAILTTAAADNLNIKMVYRGVIAGNACVAPIQLVGVDSARIDVDFYGEASTAVVNFITTACLDILITGYFFNDNTALTKNVIDTEGNGDWLVHGWDGKGGYAFSGSDAVALAYGDTAVATAAIAVIDAFHDVATANASTNTVMSDVIGNKTDAAVGTVTTDKSITAYLKGVLEDSITISGASLPATPVAGSLATYISGGSTSLGQALPADTSLVDIIGDYTGPYGGAVANDNIKAHLDLIYTDTGYIHDTAIVDPVADSLASFIVSGGTAAGQPLPASTSIVDIIGNYTGPYGGADADDNIKAQLDIQKAESVLILADTAAILAAQTGGGAGNYFAVTADLSSATWNTVAAHEIAVVTGAARLQIMVECTASTTTVSNDGTLSLGWAGNTAAIFALTDIEGGAGALVTGDIVSYVYGGTITGEVGGGRYFAETAASTVADVVIVGSVDVGYSIAVNAGATGTLVFHVWWQPMSAGATVTAGAGGPFS